MYSLFGLITSFGQNVSEDTYCIKLKKPSNENYFTNLNLDSIPNKWRSNYEKRLVNLGKLLSRFNEEPLPKSDSEVFRSIDLGAFSNLKDIVIRRIEKRDDKVVITIKFIHKLKDSTVLVHKKIIETEVWNKFKEQADPYFFSEPLIKRTNNPVHDGGATAFEGFLSNRYHYIERHSNIDPKLQALNSFLFKEAGTIFGPNCKKETREN
jgi:hypothetical protein